MRQLSHRSRTKCTLAESLDRQLGRYALAASAAGVGLLTLAPSANAKIVYTPTHHVIGPFSSHALDLDHDGKRDFIIHEVLHSGTDSLTINFLGAEEVRGNAVEGFTSSAGRKYASPLKPGQRIGASQRFVSKGYEGEGLVSTETFMGTSQVRGPWLNVKNRYLGLKFQIHGQIHYGWARLSVKRTGLFKIFATLTGYAYETVANRPIVAGAESDPDASVELLNPAVPILPMLEPASLGQLARGAAGLVAWRRREAGPLRSSS